MKKSPAQSPFFWFQVSIGPRAGDLFVADRLGKGVGESYQGCRASDVRSSMSESQAIEAERCKKHREQVA